MADWVEFTAKTVDEALTEALIKFKTTSEKVEYEVLEKESGRLLGFFSKPARIRIRKKESASETAESFLSKIFQAMGMDVEIEIKLNEADKVMSINLSGDEMGILIGKRGQTLDSLQYLISLVVNKQADDYIKIKLDTEDYRNRRKQTIENLAKNVASKVKKTRRLSSLEPMNAYERKIIHSVLQDDNMINTYSEGDEPYRKVVIVPSKDLEKYPRKNNYNSSNYRGKSSYSKK